MIKAFQHEIENVIRINLFNPMLIKYGFEPDAVLIKFKSVTEEDEALRAKWLGNLFNGFSNKALPFTNNEIRSMFGFTPLEGMDEIEQPQTTEQPQGKPKDDKEKPEEGEEEKQPYGNEETTKKPKSKKKPVKKPKKKPKCKKPKVKEEVE